MKKLQAVREAKGMDQSRLAREAGVGRQTVIRIERGDVSPTVATLYKLAGALDVPAANLLAGTSDQRAGACLWGRLALQLASGLLTKEELVIEVADWLDVDLKELGEYVVPRELQPA